MLSNAAKPYSGTVQLTAAQLPKDVLSWLIRFQIREDLASREHITVTRGQTQQALADIFSAGSSAGAAGTGDQQRVPRRARRRQQPARRTCSPSWAATRPLRSATPSSTTAGSCRPATRRSPRSPQQFSLAECRTFKGGAGACQPAVRRDNYTQDSVVTGAGHAVARRGTGRQAVHLRAVAVVLNGPGAPGAANGAGSGPAAAAAPASSRTGSADRAGDEPRESRRAC